MSSTLFSLKYSYQYIFSTLPITDIKNDFYDASIALIYSIITSCYAFIVLLYYILLFIIKLLIMAFPHAIKTLQIIYNFHKNHLTTKDLIVESFLIIILLIFFIFQKYLKRKWKQFEDYVAIKSKAAAYAAPHILFFTMSLIFSIIGKKFILIFCTSSTMPIFTILLPMLRTIHGAWLYYQYEHMPINKIQEIRRYNLMLWIILGCYHSIVTLLSILPFSKNILNYVPIIKEMIIIIIIWIQLSSIFTKIVFNSIISRIMLRISKMIPSGYNSIDDAEAKTSTITTTLTSTLMMMRILNNKQVNFLNALFQDGISALVALIFMFTPTFIAYIGMVIVAFLLPAFRTASVASISLQRSIEIYQHHNNILTTSRTRGNNNTIEGRSEEQRQHNDEAIQHWLYYWIMLAILWLIRIYVTDFWPSIMMLLTLWLQHAYFQGASKCVAYLSETYAVLSVRNHKIQMEKHSPELTFNNISETQLDSNDTSSLLIPQNDNHHDNSTLITTTRTITLSENAQEKESNRIDTTHSSSVMKHDYQSQQEIDINTTNQSQGSFSIGQASLAAEEKDIINESKWTLSEDEKEDNVAKKNR